MGWSTQRFGLQWYAARWNYRGPNTVHNSVVFLVVRSGRRRMYAPLVIAVLAPAAALAHVGLFGSWRGSDALLPSLNLPSFFSCSGIPGGPPGLKAAVLVGKLGSSLFGHHLCAVLLLGALALFGHPSRAVSRDQHRFHTIALGALCISTATLSTWILAAMFGICAQDYF